MRRQRPIALRLLPNDRRPPTRRKLPYCKTRQTPPGARRGESSAGTARTGRLVNLTNTCKYDVGVTGEPGATGRNQSFRCHRRTRDGGTRLVRCDADGGQAGHGGLAPEARSHRRPVDPARRPVDRWPSYAGSSMTSMLGWGIRSAQPICWCAQARMLGFMQTESYGNVMLIWTVWLEQVRKLLAYFKLAHAN